MRNGNQNPLANNIRFLIRNIISELLQQAGELDQPLIVNHIRVLKEGRKNTRSDGKLEINYNNIDLFFLCGHFNTLNIEKIRKNKKNAQIFDNLFEVSLQDIERLNAVTGLNRKLVTNFLNNKERYHIVLKNAKRNKEEYPKDKYEAVSLQVLDCLEQAQKGIVITNIQQEKKFMTLKYNSAFMNTIGENYNNNGSNIIIKQENNQIPSNNYYNQLQLDQQQIKFEQQDQSQIFDQNNIQLQQQLINGNQQQYQTDNNYNQEKINVKQDIYSDMQQQDIIMNLNSNSNDASSEQSTYFTNQNSNTVYKQQPETNQQKQQQNKCIGCIQKDLQILKLQDTQNQLVTQLIELQQQIKTQGNIINLNNFGTINQNNLNNNNNSFKTKELETIHDFPQILNIQNPNQQQNIQNQNNEQMVLEDTTIEVQDDDDEDDDDDLDLPNPYLFMGNNNNTNNNMNNITNNNNNGNKVNSVSEQTELQKKQFEIQQKVQENLQRQNLLQAKLSQLDNQPLFSDQIFTQAKALQDQSQSIIFKSNNNNNEQQQQYYNIQQQSQQKDIIYQKQMEMNKLNQEKQIDNNQQSQNLDYKFSNFDQSDSNSTQGQEQTSTADDNIDTYLDNQFIDFNNYNNIQLNAIQTNISNENQNLDQNASFRSKFGTQLNLDDKILNQFCSFSNTKEPVKMGGNDNNQNVNQEFGKEQKLNAYLLLQSIALLGQICNQNTEQQTLLFKQFPQFKNIKNVVSQIISTSYQKECVKQIPVQNTENSQKQEQLQQQDNNDNSNVIMTNEEHQQSLKKDFESYKKDFKEEVMKREVLPYQSNKDGQQIKNSVEAEFEKAIFNRRLGKIFQQMGKMTKALENQFLGIKSIVLATKKSCDPTTIYWLYELTLIAKQLPSQQKQKKVFPLIFSHIAISYQELISEKGQKGFKNTSQNYQGLCIYYLAKSAEILGQLNFALKLYTLCLNRYFSESDNKIEVLGDIGRILLLQKDYQNYQLFIEQQLEYSQKAYAVNHPTFIKNLQNYIQMEKLINGVNDNNQEESSNDILENNSKIQQILYEINEDSGQSYAQNILFSDLLLQNQLYQNSIDFKNKALDLTKSLLEKAYILQEISGILAVQGKLQDSIDMYEKALTQWNQYFSSEIKILKSKNQDYSYLGKMMEIKRAQIRSYQVQLHENLGQLEESVMKNKKIQNIMISVLGHFDILGLKLVVEKIDTQCKLLMTREKYCENLVYGTKTSIQIDLEMQENVKNEVLEGIVTIFNRFYLKNMYTCVAQRNMSNLVRFKKMPVIQKQQLQQNKIIDNDKIEKQDVTQVK